MLRQETWIPNYFKTNTVGYSHPSGLEVMITPMKYLSLKNLFCGRKFCIIWCIKPNWFFYWYLLPLTRWYSFWIFRLTHFICKVYSQSILLFLSQCSYFTHKTKLIFLLVYLLSLLLAVLLSSELNWAVTGECLDWLRLSSVSSQCSH